MECGMETGGILAGKHLGQFFQVTHLLIPEQTAASDRWEVQDERQITNFFVYHPELILLGLIHTHPKMTSFLSSVDLHALWDYARFNNRLVSIVLAPEKKTAPAFCLTDHGLAELSKCKETGFHRHANAASYYRVASHAKNDPAITTVIEDFRIERD
jgi:proteasome lid subunit RPN8/RPN11